MNISEIKIDSTVKLKDEFELYKSFVENDFYRNNEVRKDRAKSLANSKGKVIYKNTDINSLRIVSDTDVRTPGVEWLAIPVSAVLEVFD